MSNPIYVYRVKMATGPNTHLVSLNATQAQAEEELPKSVDLTKYTEDSNGTRTYGTSGYVIEKALVTPTKTK